MESTPTELRLVEIGNITAKLFVPSYQRGFRWGPDEVTALLDDIHDIGDQNYCLQPIVVKRSAEGDRYELVDGQQRLTTLYLLFLWMQKEGYKKPSAPFSITYESRPKSGEFLQQIDPARAKENIDFFHLQAAFETIGKWFQAREAHRIQTIVDDIYGHLFKRVQVIWYEVGPEVDSAALFARLNIGRIPLTNAELVKALLLGKSRGAGAIGPRQMEIGTQWDIIERELHEDRFWSFLTNESQGQYPTRIELLFDLMVDPAKVRDAFHTFHRFKERLDAGHSPEEVWNDVVARHALVKEWYEDRRLYHSIGYLVTEGRGQELRTLIAESEQLTKSEFEASLVEKIVRRIDIAADQFEQLSYDSDAARCSRALLLFNVESTSRLKDSFDRYDFHAHKRNQWSLEHIHAQNAEELVTKELWQAWLTAHELALRGLQEPVADAAQRVALADEIIAVIPDITKEVFAELAARVTAMFGDDGTLDVHGIENLALLQKDTNSALSNAVFEVKRQRILRKDREGEYIPICTRRVFLKYYTDSAHQQLQLWSKQDREAYLAAMKATLSAYLKPSVGSP